jgi:GNAT superfamily N-acetyltransferase
MVFWKTYTTPHTAQFQSNIVTKPHLKSPTGHPCKEAPKEDIQQFLHDHFRPHPDVIFNLPMEEIHDILTIYDDTKLVGCIRYHYIGDYESNPIHVVDCFCIHPEWRGKGVGDYLLHELHHRNLHRPYAFFLKERMPLPVTPLYCGVYAYHEIIWKPQPNVIDISTDMAYRLMDIYQKFKPFFMIRSPSKNQQWRLYRKGHHSVLCCVQDTYQTLNGKRMGWMTAWIESGITDEIREDALHQLSTVKYDMIWVDSKWATHEWNQDGVFYWYTYQWSTGVIGNSYCVIH